MGKSDKAGQIFIDAMMRPIKFKNPMDDAEMKFLDANGNHIASKIGVRGRLVVYDKDLFYKHYASIL